MVALPDSEKLLTLSDILTSSTITDVKQVMILVKAMTRLLKTLHIDELVMADLHASSVNIRNWGQVCVAYIFLYYEANIVQLDAKSVTINDSDL